MRTTKSYFVKWSATKNSKINIIQRDNKTRENKTLKLPEIDSINSKLKDNTISKDEAKKMAKDVLFELNKREAQLRGSASISSDEFDIINQYLSKKYPQRKREEIKDFKSVENEVRRVVSLVRGLQFHSSPKEDFENKLQLIERRLRNKYIFRLNSILKTFGRDFKIDSIPIQKKLEINHVTIKELNEICKYCTEEEALLFKSLFATGCRSGEIYALKNKDVKSFTVNVYAQIRRDGSLSEVKNKKSRQSVIIPEFKNDLLKWVDLEDKPDRILASKKLKKISSSIFKDKNKHISLHGLRHSYAIYLIEKEISINQVAKFLGDDIQTAQTYYVGYTSSEEEITNAFKKLKTE